MALPPTWALLLMEIDEAEDLTSPRIWKLFVIVTPPFAQRSFLIRPLLDTLADPFGT